MGILLTLIKLQHKFDICPEKIQIKQITIKEHAEKCGSLKHIWAVEILE